MLVLSSIMLGLSCLSSWFLKIKRRKPFLTDAGLCCEKGAMQCSVKVVSFSWARRCCRLRDVTQLWPGGCKGKSSRDVFLENFSVIPFLGICPPKKWKLVTQTYYVCRHVYGSNVYDSQKVETTQMSVDEQVNRMKYCKSELNVNTSHNVDDPRKHDAKTHERSHIVSFQWYEMSRTGKSLETESRFTVAQGPGRREWGGPVWRVWRGFLWGDEVV